MTGDIVVTIAELLSSSCVYFSGQKSDYDGNDLVYGFTNSKIWIFNGCEATFHICSGTLSLIYYCVLKTMSFNNTSFKFLYVNLNLIALNKIVV